jgi:hypothetical protein
MKPTKYIIGFFILLVTGCTKFNKDINIDPNNPSTASNAQLLTYAINQIPGTIETTYPSLYTQQISDKIFTDNSRYTTVNFDFYWIYSGPLQNLQTILETKSFNVTDGSKANQLAVARILKAYFFWHITDRWGDVPYFDALKGKDFFTPKYDNQKDIYYDLLKELKEAAAQIDNGNPVAGDILYDGDMDNWRRFANSMRMLMALRLSKIDPAKGKTEFADALNAGPFTSNSQNAVFKHLADEKNQNYWYYVYSIQNRKWVAISEPLVNYMKPLADPRLPVFADPAVNGGYVGMPYGIPDGAVVSANSVSFQGVHLRTQNAPTYITTYAQVLLAIAEADKLGWLPGGDADAAAKYYAAIEASVRQWNRKSFEGYIVKTPPEPDKDYNPDDPGDITGLATYIAQPGVVYDPANAIQQIAYQRWVHLYMNGYEAWAEWRRTGFPTLAPAPNNNNIPIPRRQAYTTTEQGLNENNFNAAIQAQPGLNGKNDLNGRVWWDKP